MQSSYSIEYYVSSQAYALISHCLQFHVPIFFGHERRLARGQPAARILRLAPPHPRRIALGHDLQILAQLRIRLGRRIARQRSRPAAEDLAKLVTDPAVAKPATAAFPQQPSKGFLVVRLLHFEDDKTVVTERAGHDRTLALIRYGPKRVDTIR